MVKTVITITQFWVPTSVLLFYFCDDTPWSRHFIEEFIGGIASTFRRLESIIIIVKSVEACFSAAGATSDLQVGGEI